MKAADKPFPDAMHALLIQCQKDLAMLHAARADVQACIALTQQQLAESYARLQRTAPQPPRTPDAEEPPTTAMPSIHHYDSTINTDRA